MNDQHTSVDYPVLKSITALLAGFGVSSWGDFAAMCGALYTLVLLLEFAWRKWGRPFAESQGWVKRIPRTKRT